MRSKVERHWEEAEKAEGISDGRLGANTQTEPA
jgi:hypothetical protein